MGQVTRTKFGVSYNVKLSNAQIKSLPTDSPVVLIPAIPGAVILPHIVSYILTPWVADYTNIDPTSNFGVNINSLFTPPTLTGGGMLAQGHANLIWQNTGRDYDYTPVPYDDAVNQPLVLEVTNGALNDFTGGDPSTNLYIQIFYEVLRLNRPNVA